MYEVLQTSTGDVLAVFADKDRLALWMLGQGWITDWLADLEVIDTEVPPLVA